MTDVCGDCSEYDDPEGEGIAYCPVVAEEVDATDEACDEFEVG